MRTTDGYFTFADKTTQDRMLERKHSDKRDRVERNLKSSLLINDSLVLRSYSVIESDITESIIREYMHLLESGIIIPEFRMNSEVLLKEFDKYLKKNYSAKAYMQKMEIAELMDGLATRREVDADALSYSRSVCLALLLFRLTLYPDIYMKPNVKPEDLIPIFDMLFKGIPNRGEYMKAIQNLFVNSYDATNLIQSVYFGIGAHYNNSNPIWSHEINPHRGNNLAIWMSKQPDLSILPKSNLVIAKKYGLTDLLEEHREDIIFLNEVLSQNQHSERIINSLRISDHDLDLLSMDDILELRKTMQFTNFHDHITERITEVDYAVDDHHYFKEKDVFNGRMAMFEVCCTVLSFAPKVGMIFHCGEAAAKHFGDHKLRAMLSKDLPLYSYSEAVMRKIQTNNKTKAA